VLEAAAWAIEEEDLAPVIGAEDLAEAIEGEDLAEVEPTVRGAGIFRAAAAVETGMHLGADPEATTDQAHAPTAAEVPRAWEAAGVAVGAAAVAVDGGGKHGKRI
jgi:hypothetical protein